MKTIWFINIEKISSSDLADFYELSPEDMKAKRYGVFLNVYSESGAWRHSPDCLGFQKENISEENFNKMFNFVKW